MAGQTAQTTPKKGEAAWEQQVNSYTDRMPHPRRTSDKTEDEAAQCGESELLPALLAANGGGAGGGGGALRMLVLCGDPRQARHR